MVEDLKKQLNKNPDEEKEELKKKLAEAENMLDTFRKNKDEKSWEKVEKGDDSDSEDWEEAKKKEGGRKKTRHRRNRKSRRRRKTQYKRK